MDTIPKLKILVFLLLSIPTLAFSQSAPTGYVDLAGWIKGADGIYSRAFSDGNGTRAMPSNATVNSTSTALVQTSKGITAMDIVKTANVNTARLGSAMVGLAKKAGPLGMTLTAAALVCELTAICNEAGKWMMNPPDTPEVPNSYPSANGQWWGWGTTYHPTPAAACSNRTRLDANFGAGHGSYTSVEFIDSSTYRCFGKNDGGSTFNIGNTNKLPGCAPGYVVTGSNCVKNGLTSVEATNSDLDNAAPKLNDDRVTPHLIEAGEDVPTGVPTITNTPKKVISEDTAVTKDQNGNATGTKVTSTEAEIVDAASAESPGKAIVKETTTVTNYDINNTVINSTTSTSYTSQPPTVPPTPAEPITISFDDVPDEAIEQQDVDAELETPESWGDGFCPADETIDYHYGTLTFDFQPTCDFAIGVRPVLIFMASITALFIVAGVKVE